MSTGCEKGFRISHKCVGPKSFKSQASIGNCDCPAEYECEAICTPFSAGEYEFGPFSDGFYPEESHLGTYISWQHFPRSTSTRSVCFDDSSQEILRKSISDTTETESEIQPSPQTSAEQSEKPITKSLAQLDALHYLKIRHIYELLSFLISHLVCNEPDDPIDFLVALLDKCIAFRDSYGEPPMVFTHAHIGSLYKAFDPFERNKISADQFREALYNLGIENRAEASEEELPLNEDGQIDVKYFEFEVEKRRIGSLRQMLRIPKNWEENRYKWAKKMKKKPSKRREINASHISQEKTSQDRTCNCSDMEVTRVYECQCVDRNIPTFLETEQLYFDYYGSTTNGNSH